MSIEGMDGIAASVGKSNKSKKLVLLHWRACLILVETRDKN
jgi:hypothetical protein